MSLAALRREFLNHSLDFQIISHYSLFDHFWSSSMNRSVPLAEAKATLSDCIREVEGGKSVLITRHGKPVAALVHPKDLDNLERLKKAGPEGGLASLAGGWEGSDELARLLDESARIGQRDVAGFE
jgi:prevent-host-death family protein